MKPIVLFRQSLAESGELSVCSSYLPTVQQRTQIGRGYTVICRYSALPFYKELENDIKYLGSTLINSYEEHLYVADMQNWYEDLKHVTPKTWFRVSDIDQNGPFVLKGQTNSKKQLWDTHMFAATLSDATKVMMRLMDDDFIGDQNIYARQYMPLKKLADGLHGLPITEEYRFFVLDGEILSGAFYWSNYSDELSNLNLNAQNVPIDFLNEIITIVKPNIRFFVMDIAHTANNQWLLIELNDGQMSGLSDNNPHDLYKGIKEKLN